MKILFQLKLKLIIKKIIILKKLLKKNKWDEENNKLISQFDSYEIYQLLYINSSPIVQYYDQIENKKENQDYGLVNITFPETYIKIYNF